MSHIAVEAPPRRHRLSVADYYRMAEVGILRPDERVELIDGEIIDMAPVGSRHASVVSRLAELFQAAARDVVTVWSQSSVQLGDFSQPEPDLALLRRRTDFYWSAHPRADDVLLIVEVAESSLSFDRDVKLPLYARHHIPEVWLIDIQSRRLTRYRKPMQGKYSQVEDCDLAKPLSVEAIGGVAIGLNELFPRP